MTSFRTKPTQTSDETCKARSACGTCVMWAPWVTLLFFVLGCGHISGSAGEARLEEDTEPTESTSPTSSSQDGDDSEKPVGGPTDPSSATPQQRVEAMWPRYQHVDVRRVRGGRLTPAEALQFSAWLAEDGEVLRAWIEHRKGADRDGRIEWSRSLLDTDRFVHDRDGLFILGAGVRVHAAPPGIAGHAHLLGMLYTGDEVAQCQALDANGELWLRIAESNRACDDSPERWIAVGDESFDYISYQPVPEEILAFMGRVALDPSTRWPQRADAYFDGHDHPWPPPDVMERLRGLPQECIEEAGNELMGLLLGPAIVAGLVAADVPLGLSIGIGAITTGLLIYTINCIIYEREWQLDKAVVSSVETFVATLGWFGKALSTAFGWAPCIDRLYMSRTTAGKAAKSFSVPAIHACPASPAAMCSRYPTREAHHD